MMTNLAEERLVGADGYLARAERAFEITMEFIKERKAFGKPVGTFQNSRFVMADARTKLDVGWAYLDHCAMAHIDGECTAEMAAQAKLFTSEIEGEIIDACLQLHGGAGYMEEYEISRLYVDARISRIYAGTSEIMREIIGRGLGLDDRQKG
jgi:alkylation response protein AidB-like acyl-CoA dehydrogenase